MTTSDPPKRPRLKGVHDPDRDDDCPICQSPHQNVIEDLYMSYKKMDFLEEVSGESSAVIKKHMVALGLTKKRADNTEDLIAYAIDASFDRGVLDELDADQLLRLIQHQDKKLGKVREHSDPRPPQIIVMVPDPGGIGPDRNTTLEAIPGRVVALPAPDKED